ncbi:MAG: hypothetical protein LBK22_04500 [Tannerella sp.]|jgi:hypothetical protein|nr:hypothetical protein [Tannerella sp.]
MRIDSSDEGLSALELTALGNARGVMRPVEMHLPFLPFAAKQLLLPFGNSKTTVYGN